MSIKDRTESLWEQVKLPPFEALKNNERTEVCIVGGGITGMSVAYELAKRGFKIILLEAFGLGSGQTGRTTAHLSSQLEEEFTKLLKIHSPETIKLFHQAHQRAIDIIEENIKREGIECDFMRVEGFLFQGKNFTPEKLKQELEAAEKCGVDVEYVENVPLLESPTPGIKFKNQAQFNPLKYLAGLLRAMEKFDVKIYEGTHVMDMKQEDRENWTILTDAGHEIAAKHLVVATNTPVNNRFHIHTRQFAYRTYAMGFKVNKASGSYLLWDTEDPYHYIRFVGSTLVVGGEDHRTGNNPENDPFLELEKWTRSKFNFVGECVYSWSGQVFEPADQIAFIGKNPGLEKNVYISTGESGIGMTSATIASKIIPDLIENKENPWAPIFDPTRPSTKALKELVSENIHTAIQYTDWISPSPVHALDDIPLDQGGLIREGLTKTCFYHDINHFERKSAVCTHLGGIVHWNDIEKTWDCPCHGSRFNTKGKVIEGPALSDLMEK